MRAKFVITVIAVMLMVVAVAFQSKAKPPVREIVLPDIVITQ